MRHLHDKRYFLFMFKKTTKKYLISDNGIGVLQNDPVRPGTGGILLVGGCLLPRSYTSAALADCITGYCLEEL